MEVKKKSLIGTVNLSLLSEGLKNDTVHVARCLIGVSLILTTILSFSTWINRMQRAVNCQSDSARVNQTFCRVSAIIHCSLTTTNFFNQI